MRIALASLCLAGVAAAQRLPDEVVPVKHALTLEPDLQKGTFRGEAVIEVRVKKPVRAIALNAIDLTVERAQLGAEVAKVSVDAAAETVTLSVDKPVSGAVRIALAWSGRLSEKLSGFYLAKDGEARFALTDFEPADARRAFPCFDEPAKKARFTITAIVPAGLTAISNGAVVEERTVGDKRVVRFAETPPLSTYLVALAVGPFESAEAKAGGLRVRAFAPRGQGRFLRYALDEAVALLPRLERYFGVKYPYDKLDLVAVPDFQSGAMENAGAIFFRTAALLVDEHAGAAQRRRVTEIVAHEMAHQWFGDLVTMKWWDDLWLNEAFATWMEAKIVDGLHPEWQLPVDAVADGADAMELDGLAATHPIRAPIKMPRDALSAFDRITYSKGAAVLRMIERWLGEDNFRRGVSLYLSRHREKNATAEDLWRALGEASKRPVAAVAGAWIDRPGHPMLVVGAECKAGALEVSLAQDRFFAVERAPNEKPSLRKSSPWPVPVCLRSDGESRCVLFTKERETVRLKGCALISANAGASGFFRAAYSGVRPDASQMTPAERLGWLSDQWALALAGAAPVAEVLDALASLRGERARAVVQLGLDILYYMRDHLVPAAQEAGFARFVEAQLAPVASELGWEPKANEDDETRLLRGAVLRALGALGRSPEVLAEAERRLPAYLKDPASLDGSVADAVVALGAARGNAARFDAYLSRLRSSSVPEDKERLLKALTAFEEPSLVERALGLTLGEVRAQDLRHLYLRWFDAPRARDRAWAFFRANFAALQKRLPEAQMTRVVRGLGHFCELERLDEFRALLGPARELAEVNEHVTQCARARERHAAPLAEYLSVYTSSPGAGTRQRTNR